MRPRLEVKSRIQREVVSLQRIRAVYVDTGQSPPCHALPLRPPDRSRTTGGQAAAGTALPHPRTELLAQGDAGAAFRELAAGPERKLARALRIPGKDPRIRRHRRPDRRHGGDSFLLL